ncbi:uncharacterized protein LOC102704232 [Oryza brachyantha]|uniref:uncharacterized protein LOC102704232 n=1 Tax=Oryza brachyantha TaxID=4533 RepID=UPI0007761CE3|nr:uncharacterized protein LOC102704232 [Oryza brachyantha]
MPLFKLLKKTDHFTWTPEDQEAFEDFKKYLTSAPVLASPNPNEPLLLYVSATEQVVSTVLVVEREEEGHAQLVQRPVYFVNEVLGESKIKYPQVQKLFYGVLITVRKLVHYFQAHQVSVVTSYPLGDIIHNKEVLGRIAKWALEMMPYDITFKPRTAELQTIPISWSFAVWGLDIVGIFKRAPGGFTHLFVAIDKFTKWIEAKLVATIDSAHARDFIQNIIYRFNIPNRIITDNGRQFISGVFQDFCEERGIKICYASVAHSKSNGQVERANGMILQGIKTRVFDRQHPYAKRWVQELPPVLWALRISISRAMGQSPFFLVYGAEVVLPTKIDHESFRIRNYNESTANTAREDDLNRLEEARDVTTIQSARYLQGLCRYHNRNVRGRAFLVGDLFLCKVQTTKDRHKLSLIWEGPYVIAEVTQPGTYRLRMKDERLLENSWNIEQLRPFHTVDFL